MIASSWSVLGEIVVIMASSEAPTSSLFSSGAGYTTNGAAVEPGVVVEVVTTSFLAAVSTPDSTLFSLLASLATLLMSCNTPELALTPPWAGTSAVYSVSESSA